MRCSFPFFLTALSLLLACGQSTVPGEADKFKHAETELHDGDYEEAIASFSFYLSIHPDHAKALRGRGTAHLLLGDLDKARRDLDTVAIRLAPDDYVAYALRSNAYRLLGETEKARNDAETAHRLNPDWPASDLMESSEHHLVPESLHPCDRNSISVVDSRRGRCRQKLNATLETTSLCPSRLKSILLVARSQTFTVLSSLPDATRWPSGLNVTHVSHPS